MRSKWWYLAGCLIAGWQLVSSAIDAFSTPWLWNLDQCFTALMGVSLTILLVLWAVVWKRGGMALVRARWAAAERGRRGPSKTVFAFSLVFWIFAAVGMTIFFYMRQP
jgi:hypothetical protein